MRATMFLLFHSGGILFSLGFTIVMCVVLVLLFTALPSRKNKMGNRKFRDKSSVANSYVPRSRYSQLPSAHLSVVAA
jgi:hypothetical protein